MNPISTNDQLPDAHSEILWWHPRTLDWRLGFFWAESGTYAPGFFKASGGAWYVRNGPTWWMPVPLDPTLGEVAERPVIEHEEKRLFCQRPDRDSPGTICGYPLPCPWHTAVIDLAPDPPTVTIPVTASPSVNPLTLQRIKRVANVLADDIE